MKMSEIYNGSQWVYDIFSVNNTEAVNKSGADPPSCQWLLQFDS